MKQNKDNNLDEKVIDLLFNLQDELFSSRLDYLYSKIKFLKQELDYLNNKKFFFFQKEKKAIWKARIASINLEIDKYYKKVNEELKDMSRLYDIDK